MIERIISGGQTGADRAGLDAAMACGIAHGGWCPKGRLAEDGPIPERYQLTETEGASYLARTERNVKRSDGTAIITIGELAGGSARTADFARRHKKPHLHLRLDGMSDEQAVGSLRDFIAQHAVRVLNVAGSRAGSEPEIYERCKTVITVLLQQASAEQNRV
jgi:hypothetical protein